MCENNLCAQCVRTICAHRRLPVQRPLPCHGLAGCPVRPQFCVPLCPGSYLTLQRVFFNDSKSGGFLVMQSIPLDHVEPKNVGPTNRFIYCTLGVW